MSEYTDQTSDDVVTGADVVDGQLVLRRKDGSTENVPMSGFTPARFHFLPSATIEMNSSEQTYVDLSSGDEDSFMTGFTLAEENTRLVVQEAGLYAASFVPAITRGVGAEGNVSASLFCRQEPLGALEMAGAATVPGEGSAVFPLSTVKRMSVDDWFAFYGVCSGVDGVIEMWSWIQVERIG